MKKYFGMKVFKIALIIAIVIGVEARTQEKKIGRKDMPQAVLSAFEKSFPDAKVKSFSTESEDGKTYFEIESVRNKMTLDVSYLPDGSAMEIEQGITVGELLDAVKAAVKANYPHGRIAKAEKRTIGTTETFELQVTSGKSRVSLEIASGGKIIKRSEEHKGD
jgi:hypothetical protein